MKLKPNSYIEVSLSLRKSEQKYFATAQEFFLTNGIHFNEVVRFDTKRHVRLSYYIKSSSRARKLHEKFKKGRTQGIEFKARILGQKDWLDKWMIDYHTMNVGKRFTIVPVWEKENYKLDKRIPLFIEPRSAFGSGLHESTKMMLKLIESLEGKIEQFLDLGTGTGILSVAAYRMGAKKLYGMDQERIAVQTARANVKRNGCLKASYKRSELKRYRLGAKVDVVAANLITQTLLDDQKRIFSMLEPGGHLLVSGVSRKHQMLFQKGFRQKGLRCLKVMRSRSWTAYLYRKQGRTKKGDS